MNGKMNDEVLYSIALTKVLPKNYLAQNILLERCGSARGVYDNRHSLRDTLPDASDKLVQAVSGMDEYLPFAEKEMLFVREKGIECLCKSDSRYPKLLRECGDAPIILFYRGAVDLNALRVISIVGTRRCTEYGQAFCRHFLRDLRKLFPDVLVVSGLAYGIDIAAHRAAMENGLSTVCVLAHGMEQIYPRSHERDAVEMEKNGGVLTEYTSYSNMEKINFVSRNRIVAGISQATIVVESKVKGGALITANMANGYNREVFAVPGCIDKEESAGCNALIRDNKATLLMSAQDFVFHLGWATSADELRSIQREIFPELTDEERTIVTRLRATREGLDVNQLSVDTNIAPFRLVALLPDLEARNVVKMLSGGRFVLL